MFRITFLAVALVLALGGCETPEPEASDSPEEAETAILNFFSAIESLDFDRIRASVTADFEIIEDTVVFDTEGFIDLIGPFRDMGATISYEFSDFNTEVAGTSAWTRYHNRAVMLMNDETTRFVWIETAVLQKVEGTWLVDRLHSMTIEVEADGD